MLKLTSLEVLFLKDVIIRLISSSIETFEIACYLSGLGDCKGAYFDPKLGNVDIKTPLVCLCVL